MHNVLIISYIAFSIGNLFILPESVTDVAIFYPGVLHLRENSLHLYGPSDDFGFRSRR